MSCCKSNFRFSPLWLHAPRKLLKTASANDGLQNLCFILLNARAEAILQSCRMRCLSVSEKLPCRVIPSTGKLQRWKSGPRESSRKFSSSPNLISPQRIFFSPAAHEVSRPRVNTCIITALFHNKCRREFLTYRRGRRSAERSSSSASQACL